MMQNHMKGKILSVLLLIPLFAMGQREKPWNLTTIDYQPFHFGYSVGINWMSFTTLPKDSFSVETLQHPGININLLTKLKLGKYIDLRFTPGIQFSQRDISVHQYWKDPDTAHVIKSWGPKKIESVYLEFPFLIKYRSKRVNNFAPYLIAGINPRVDLTGGEIQNWKPVKRLVRVFDIFPELGVGIDFYTPRVKVGTELKFSVGMLNVYKPPGEDPGYELYANGIKSIFSRMVILAVNIE